MDRWWVGEWEKGGWTGRWVDEWPDNWVGEYSLRGRKEEMNLSRTSVLTLQQWLGRGIVYCSFDDLILFDFLCEI